jgi:hypothetical protein
MNMGICSCHDFATTITSRRHHAMSRAGFHEQQPSIFAEHAAVGDWSTAQQSSAGNHPWSSKALLALSLALADP